jgi:hypothetical protein
MYTYYFTTFNENKEIIKTYVKVCSYPKRTKLYKILLNKLNRNLIHGFEFCIASELNN